MAADLSLSDLSVSQYDSPLYETHHCLAVAEKSAPGNHVQSVAASVAAERSVPLFYIKPVTAEGRGVRELGRLDDKGGTEPWLRVGLFVE